MEAAMDVGDYRDARGEDRTGKGDQGGNTSLKGNCLRYGSGTVQGCGGRSGLLFAERSAAEKRRFYA